MTLPQLRGARRAGLGGNAASMESPMAQTSFDLSFRPKSYWLFSDPAKKALATVVGEQHRFAAAALESGESPGAWLDALPPGEGPCVGSSPMSLMAGEYLPPRQRGEVEIARVAYASVLGDVVSISARWFRGKIRYRITDDFAENRAKEFPYSFEPRSSDAPLTMGELIGIIDDVVDPWADGRAGLVLGFVQEQVTLGVDPDSMVRFVRVTSAHYPQLGAYYVHELAAWRERVRATQEAEEREERKRELLARRAARRREREENRVIAASPPKPPWELPTELTVQDLGRVDRGLLEKWLRTLPGFDDGTITVGCQRYGHPMRTMSKIRYLHFDWTQEGASQWLEVGPGTVRAAFEKLALHAPAVADLLADSCAQPQHCLGSGLMDE